MGIYHKVQIKAGIDVMLLECDRNLSKSEVLIKLFQPNWMELSALRESEIISQLYSVLCVLRAQ